MPDSILAECVGVAVLAPSLHNSQPWRFRIRDGGGDVLAAPDRQLHALDHPGTAHRHQPRPLVLRVGLGSAAAATPRRPLSEVLVP